jgi:elongator complex protein 3
MRVNPLPRPANGRVYKPTRTISGVSPIAIVVEPRKCPHGTCVYCPSWEVPQSYTPKSPAIMRAARLKYDPYPQVKSRLAAFEAMGHPTDKMELIIMGGTFLAYPVEYQYQFIKRCYDALNDVDAKNLEYAKHINETAEHRCVAMCLETRPDVCGPAEIKRMLDFGATRCEIGVQLPDDEIYALVKRRHTVADVKKATKLLKEAGFKVGYHLMPGLPGSDAKRDVKRFKELFDSEDFMPDQIKIYPTLVIKGSELERWHAEGKYTPYTEKDLVDLTVKLKSLVPKWCRIMHIMRIIPPEYLVAGSTRSDLRKVAQAEMKTRGIRCQCIRCREVGFAERQKKDTSGELKLETLSYDASGGKEYFLSFVNPHDFIFGLCRLRINADGKTAMLRELHVFGPEMRIGAEDGEGSKTQHKGLGAKMMVEAERIASEHGCERMDVISGIGVREYYRNLGYALEGPYMVKTLAEKKQGRKPAHKRKLIL